MFSASASPARRWDFWWRGIFSEGDRPQRNAFRPPTNFFYFRISIISSREQMVGGTWIEHVTPTMSTWCSTAELTAHTIALKRGWVYREASSIASFRLLGARYDFRF